MARKSFKSTRNMSKDIIRVLKTQYDMTLPEIVKLVGTNKAFLSRVEKGHANFTLEHIKKMEKAGIPVFVSLGKDIENKLVIKYRNKGQEVPKETQEVCTALMKYLIGSAMLKLPKKIVPRIDE